VPEYLSSYSMWYSSYEHYSILEYALIFGFYGGTITGFLADKLSQRFTFILAAILGAASYCLIPEFDGSSRMKQETWQFYVLATSVFMVGQSSSLAIISTIKVSLKNFSISTSPIILSILLSYLYITEHIEGSIRWSFFFGLDNKWYMYGVAGTSTVIYLIAAFVMTIDEGNRDNGSVSEYQLATLDKVGLSVFVIYEIFMILLLLLFKLVIKDVSISTWICVILLVGNFIIPMINAEFILGRASDLLSGFSPNVHDLGKLQKGKDKAILSSLKSCKLFTLFLVTVIMLGAGSLVYEKLTKISIAISMNFLAEYAMIWFIFGNFVTRLLIGTTFILLNYINDFSYMVFFGIEIFLAMLLILLTPNESVIMFNIA
jgi:MFS family permease